MEEPLMAVEMGIGRGFLEMGGTSVGVPRYRNWIAIDSQANSPKLHSSANGPRCAGFPVFPAGIVGYPALGSRVG